MTILRFFDRLGPPGKAGRAFYYIVQQERIMLNSADILLALKTPATLLVLDEADSTNNVAKQLAAAGSPVSAVLARRQTCGRGRRTKSFLSPEGGIYLSLVLPPDADFTRLTMAAAVAVCRALKNELGLDAGIKWVNDIYLNGKKVCGILAEGSLSPSGLNHAVIGVGLNFAVPPFEGELALTAASLYPAGNPPISISRMAAALIDELMLAAANPRDAGILQEYRTRSIVIGRTVHLLREGGGMAFACDILPDGKLLVRHPDGSCEALFTGDISIAVN